MTRDAVCRVEPVPTLAIGLRGLLVSGEQLRGFLARQLRLGPSDLNALGHLYTDGPLTPRELAQRLDTSSGTITALLDRVERAGFLTRSVNPHDRRSLHITLTVAGQQALRWVHSNIQATLEQAIPELPDLSADELAAVLAVLGRALAARATSEAPGYAPVVSAAPHANKPQVPGRRTDNLPSLHEAPTQRSM
ncbi:MAG: hypothetical protein QOI74_2044 [Micromonosporaceae bacterium]|jgi:DNA-binding MarR family transcriptional regulator|nr:hypothetical protein [Micromonosporaceae bacterium]